MKKNGKRAIIIAIVILVAIGVIFYLVISQKNHLSSSERQWLNNNSSKVQNIYILNDANVFGNTGEGAYYSFLNDFASEYSLTVNKITMTSSEQPSSLSLMVGNGLANNATEFYQDHYVLVGKNEEMVYNKKELISKTVGVLTNNADYVKSYLTDISNMNVKTYDTKDELIAGLESSEVNFIIVPRIEYIDTILAKKYWINYHFSDMSRDYYFMDASNSTLYSIMQKYFASWSESNLKKYMYSNELSIFKSKLDISETELDNLKKAGITYGYKSYLPYEVYGDGTYGGIVGEYLKSFSSFSGIEIDYKKYDNDKTFAKDISSDKVSLYTNFYNTSSAGSNWVSISTNMPINLGIYVYAENSEYLDSEQAIKNQTLYVEDSSTVQAKLSTKSFNTETFKLKDLSKVLKDKTKVIALDENIGNYLLKTTLYKYTLRYVYSMNNVYTMQSSNNETFNKLLTRYINYLDNNTIKLEGTYNSEVIEHRGSIMSSVARYVLYFILIVGIILFLVYRSSKKVKLQKKIKKEDKLKFVDHLTSLKNRNYLNENLATWNKNTIYPQSVIMIDLNRVQEINDTLGYEEGDKQIQAAANILIKTQLDNTDVIRTDGNEFMVYLIGYDQKQVTSYIHKLTKEFKDLPYDYGECISYSMIENNLKLIDDAINECIEDIKKQKEDVK